MSLRGRQGWIFDLDGTLALPVHDFDDLREALGIPPGVLILEYLASRPAAEAKALGARLEALEAELIAQCRPQPGIRKALEALRNRGGHLGVVTRNSVANAHLTLAQLGLDDLFAPSAVLGRESAAPKPSPEALHRLLRQWHLDPDACVMLGEVPLPEGESRKWQDWEYSWVPLMFSALFIWTVAWNFRPKLGLANWARTEALARLEAEESEE